jgi:uncharacterized tellurite resistance protein B-like protein
MLQQIKVFFKDRMEITRSAPASLKEQSIQMATCAVLLEAAMADGEFTGEEMEHIYCALQHLYGMDRETIEGLLSVAMEERKRAVDLWQFTNLINQHYDAEQKMLLLEHVWRVILSDGTLDQFEDYLARQLMPLLHLDHKQWINAKMRAKETLKGEVG